MKQDRITILYKGLDNRQRAALAFRYLASGNDLEFERVLSAVPVKKYSAPDLDYQNRLDGMTQMTLFWAIEHWRAQADKFGALAQRLALQKRGDRQKAKATDLAHDAAECRLLALDAALEAVCAEIGVDANAVRKLARVDLFEPTHPNRQPDPDYLAQIHTALTRLAMG